MYMALKVLFPAKLPEFNSQYLVFKAALDAANSAKWLLSITIYILDFYLDFLWIDPNRWKSTIFHEVPLMVFVENQTIAILEAKTTLFTMIYIKSKWAHRCRVTCATALLNVLYAKSRLFLEKLLFIFSRNSLSFHSKSILKLTPLNAPSNSLLKFIRK